MGTEKVTAVAVALAERKVVFLETIVQISSLEEDVGLAEEVVDLTAVQSQSRAMHNPFNLLQLSFHLHSHNSSKIYSPLKNYLVLKISFFGIRLDVGCVEALRGVLHVPGVLS